MTKLEKLYQNMADTLEQGMTDLEKFEAGSTASVFNANTNNFESKKGLTFLLRLDTGSTTASVVLRRQ